MNSVLEKNQVQAAKVMWMLLIVLLLGQSGTAGPVWNKYWDSLDSASQLGTLLGVAGALG